MIPQTNAVDPERIPQSKLHEMLRRMLRIRIFEREAARVQSDLIPGMMHGATGQEATIVGACMALESDDYMTGNHRSHGHPIGKGANLGPLMAELCGKRGGVCRGKGGSMHLAAFSLGSLGESGIVGASMPVAVGAALSARLRNSRQVCLSFFGDGAANCGLFHESLNLASIWKLPVIFLCENNGYATCTSAAQTTSVGDIATRAGSYSMPGVVADGQDVLAVYSAVSAATRRARKGDGPTLIEAKTYRYNDHVENAEYPTYRSIEEVNFWKTRDPIEIFTAALVDAKKLTGRELNTIEQEVKSEVSGAILFAKESPVPEREELIEDVFA